MQLDWVLSLRDQCVQAGVPFFFKQWGEWMQLSVKGAEFQSAMKRVGKKAAGRTLEGRTWDEIPDVETLLATRMAQS